MASVVAATTAVAGHPPGTEEPVVAPLAQAALVLISIAPLFLPVNTNVNVIATAALAVYVGCRRSVKDGDGRSEDVMTNADALRFPLVGSAVLLGLFILFKFFNKDLVNALLTTYFVVLGWIAMSGTILPFVEVPFSATTISHSYNQHLKVPFVKGGVHMSVTLPEVASFAVSALFCVWYFMQKHWLANNALGLAFSIQGIEHISIGKLSTGAVLLSGLFFYDIFWVFGTPVMVTVAKSLDAPIKLLFPRAGAEASASPFAMLGLGDIVIPGIVVALCLRYDVAHGTKYFRSAFGGYFAGLATTIVVMNVFQAAQPALLYIVPAVLGAVSIHSLWNSEFSQLWSWSEEVVKEATEEAVAQVGADTDKSVLEKTRKDN